MKYKKFILLSLLTLLVSCNKIPVGDPEYTVYDDTKYNASVDNEGYTLIDFYALNDFHGALEENKSEKEPGIAALNTLLNDKRKENPGGTVLIANGDMWQGSADSNITRGKIVNHTFNYMGFASFTLGNHEFDWGINQIKANKEHSNFPYLGQNIFYKDTNERADFIDESPLIERDGVKIGIIGTIGSDLINTVEASLVANISFDPITEYVREEATRLREIGANLVILAAHDTWVPSNLTPERSALLDDNVIDAVFTGHQHVLDNQVVNGIPVLQTNGRGRQVMHVRYGYHKELNQTKLVSSTVIENIADMNLKKDAVSEKIYDHYYRQYEVAKIKNEVLGKVVKRDMQELAVAKFTVEVMSKAFPEAVGAFHNVEGGIRATFPKGKITYNNVYKALPFDNEVYLVELLGSRLRNLMNYSGNYAFYFTIKESEIVNNEYYKIVTISFIHSSDNSPVKGTPFENKFIYVRDLVADYIRENKTIDGSKY